MLIHVWIHVSKVLRRRLHDVSSFELSRYSDQRLIDPLCAVCAVNQWRRNEIDIAGTRRDPKARSSKPEELSRGETFWGEGRNSSSYHLRSLGEQCKLPYSEVR